jgi:hypothetical protein
VTLALEEHRAWQLYRAQTRNLTGERYFAVEAWAWAQLQQKLLDLHKQRVRAAA